MALVRAQGTRDVALVDAKPQPFHLKSNHFSYFDKRASGRQQLSEDAAQGKGLRVSD